MAHGAVAKLEYALFNIARQIASQEQHVCGVGKFLQVKTVLLGLGANLPGRWGTPRQTLERAQRELEHAGVSIARRSAYYSTKPVGDTPQPRYLNAVVLARTRMAPGALLRLLKRIERSAGRRTSRAMSSRPLDVDILDFGGRRTGAGGGRRVRGQLILPHPAMHQRAFVLVPLLEVAPFWRHPVYGLRPKALLARLAPADRAGVRATT